MKEEIKKLCARIEKEQNVKILFAIENGSRVWGMSSKDSDYDVRFVFVRPVDEYVQINKPGDVIQAAFDSKFEKCPVEGSLIDMSGFDIFKYTKMLSSSNPTTIEWLMSDIVYYGSQNERFKEFAKNCFSKKSLYFHYKSLCKNNYIKYLKTGTFVTHKKYLYAYRGLINAKWVVVHESIPPIKFLDALAGMKEIIPDIVIEKLKKIIELKKEGKEKDKVANIKEMDSYIEEFLKNDSEAPTEKSFATLNDLNSELRKIVIGKRCCK
ncbi:hypothetical protein HN587_01690 [Candidatus Woesearchaeota archaeon]|jgi:uncharacterized protein|nr:hypothetical protein [Candidatus Woesearchaeota archaeon]